MYIMIICHWAILHYNMSFKTIAGRSDGVFFWYPALSEDQEFFFFFLIHQNYLVALISYQNAYIKKKFIFLTWRYEYCQLRARRVLTLFCRKLEGRALNSINTLLFLRWQYQLHYFSWYVIILLFTWKLVKWNRKKKSTWTNCYGNPAYFVLW